MAFQFGGRVIVEDLDYISSNALRHPPIGDSEVYKQDLLICRDLRS